MRVMREVREIAATRTSRDGEASSVESSGAPSDIQSRTRVSFLPTLKKNKKRRKSVLDFSSFSSQATLEKKKMARLVRRATVRVRVSLFFPRPDASSHLIHNRIFPPVGGTAGVARRGRNDCGLLRRRHGSRGHDGRGALFVAALPGPEIHGGTGG